jgi:2-succinyl-5-enolpyruvyl-6-hydroxy-3-cyclohexene-1-carboxylate synthase
MTAAGQRNDRWCGRLTDELVRHGVDCFCVSSGARCAPLTLAVARHPRCRAVVHVDERASAFYAVGYGRATRRPAVWLTTSGTAAAEGFAAVIEAAQEGVPLIALTADRPPELRDTGSNQTIRQAGLFGAYARWFVDLPCPDEAIDSAYVQTTVAQALEQAGGVEPGVVHMNVMLREPLTAGGASVEAEAESAEPYTRIGRSVVGLAADACAALKARLERAENGVLVVGRLEGEADRQAVLRLMDVLPWPVLVDVTSGLRLGARDGQRVLFGDQVLLAPPRGLTPDVILQVGRPGVSKRVGQWCAAAGADWIQVKSTEGRLDPHHRVRWTVRADLPAAVAALREAGLAGQVARALPLWHQADVLVEDVVREWLAAEGPLDEMVVAATLSALVPPTHGLFLGASMPVRDMDMYGLPGTGLFPVAANRGASGIDGTVSSACGWSAGLGRPVVVLLGDLACLHDLNGLDYVRRAAQPVVIVVVNNNGGGIFSFLPLAGEAEPVFEQVFGTPHDLDFQHAAAQFGLPYRLIKDRSACQSTMESVLESGQSALVEVQTDRAQNHAAHVQLQDCIRLKMSELQA